jgi:ribosomal protein L24
MSQYRYRLFDPVLSAAEADAMLRLCERFGRYKMYSSEAAEAEIGQGLAQRHDAVMNFIKTGGRRGEGGSVEEVVARTNYFREEYAYGDRVVIEGIEPFLHHEGFVEAAKAIHGRPVIEPAIVYANILVAGQELAVHTDVPEFRGANRRKFPQWLMVVMHHSGLFDAWRMPIVTAVSWWNRCRGGEFVYYPEGAAGAPETLLAKSNTAIALDTDSVFHGVDRVDPQAKVAALRPGMHLCFEDDGRWAVRADDRVVARYDWESIRFSISWKAYCFADEAERRAWRNHTDDLELDVILDRLVDDLRARGRIDGERPQPNDLALMMIDEYIRFPGAVQ